MASNTNTDIWIAGAFAAFTVDLLVYPLDTIKTRIQAPDYKKLYTENGKATSSLFRGLYQGIGSIILVTLPASGAFFTTYEALKYTLNDSFQPNSTLYMPAPVINAVSSGGAELVSCAILTPAEVIKQNAQVIQREVKGPAPTFKVLNEFRKNPFRLWNGYTALAGRNLPFTAMQFPIFEHFKTKLMERRRQQKGGEKVDGILERAWITAVSAGTAGSGAAWITTPIDVIKTRMMLAAGKPEQAAKEGKDIGQLLTQGLGSRSRKGLWETAREVAQTDGLRGFFRGAALRAAWTALGSGLYLGVYEGGRFYLEDSRKAKNEGDHLMERDLSKVKVGVGASRSQGDRVGKSGWQDDKP